MYMKQNQILVSTYSSTIDYYNDSKIEIVPLVFLLIILYSDPIIYNKIRIHLVDLF